MTREGPVDLRTKLLYGIGATAFGVKDNGFSGFLLLYYNQVLGLPEAWVGFGIMMALVLDGIFDRLLGETVLQLEGKHREAIDEETEVERALRLVAAVAKLARDAEAVGGIALGSFRVAW